MGPQPMLWICRHCGLDNRHEPPGVLQQILLVQAVGGEGELDTPVLEGRGVRRRPLPVPQIRQRDIERVPLTLENFIAREPPILVGMFFLACINGTIGLFWALFFRETAAGPGGEFGKGIVALRKEVVKGIFRFFGSILGSYVRER